MIRQTNSIKVNFICSVYYIYVYYVKYSISQWTQVIVQFLSCILFPGSYISHNVRQLSNVC